MAESYITNGARYFLCNYEEAIELPKKQIETNALFENGAMSGKKSNLVLVPSAKKELSLVYFPDAHNFDSVQILKFVLNSAGYERLLQKGAVSAIEGELEVLVQDLARFSGQPTSL